MNEYLFKDRGISYRKNEFLPNRQTLVWIHGLSGSASAWFPYEKIFSNYNLLTFDLRGHGMSDRPSRYEDYELRKSADDVNALLEYLHIGKCILVSHSFGTLVALEFASAHKEKVSSIIFLSPISFLRNMSSFRFVKVIVPCVLALCRLMPFQTSKRGRVDYSIFKYTVDWDLNRIFRDVRNTTVHAYLYCFFQTYMRSYDDVWKGISVPTLIIHGTRDSMVPVQHSVRLAEIISSSELVLLKDANHIIVLNNINEISEHIKRFLNAQ